MGKKGKRSKRGQAKNVNTNTIVIHNIFNRVNENFARARKSSLKRLHSDSISTLKESLQFILAKEAIIFKRAKTIEDTLDYEMIAIQVYSSLLIEYYVVCNYEKVIQIFNWFASKVNITAALKVITSDSHETSYKERLMLLILIYRDLALIRVGNDVCADSLFQDATNYMKKAKDRDSVNTCRLRILSCLRATKNFDTAVDMEMKFAAMDMETKFTLTGNLDKEERFEEVAASLAVTYMERYRVEFHKHTQKENEQEFGRITEFLLRTSPKEDWQPVGYNDPELQLSNAIAIAQWNYLFSKTIKREDKRWTGARRQAIHYVRYFLGAKWHLKDNCFYCHQAPTKDEVKYVCGDCRVACYCSIDHQRASWKKNALHDMCFGHEAICPAMKAYRKWQEAADSGDIEKEKKTERRLGRECLGFLAYGLGLENKCYDIEEVESG